MTLRSIWRHPSNRGQRARAVARYFWWQASKRVRKGSYDLAYHGLKLRCYPDSHSASAALYFSGLPDYREMQFMRRFLRAGDCYVDVGANVGVYTLLAASLVGHTGVVHAFEPMQRTCDRLRENVAINRLENVHCHDVALSDHAGIAQFADSADDALSSLAYGGQASASSQVECSTVDHRFDGTAITMMKLDVEGAEPLVLRGARAQLAMGNPPVIQIEMDGYSARFGVETHELIGEIEALGYEVTIYEPASNRLVQTRRPWEHRVLNVLAIHVGSKGMVEARLLEPAS